jgi:hypothetical protein
MRKFVGYHKFALLFFTLATLGYVEDLIGSKNAIVIVVYLQSASVSTKARPVVPG